MNSVTQENRYPASWAAPEILEGADEITREADVFAFGMVVTEVCPRTSPHPVFEMGGWMVRLTSESYLYKVFTGKRPFSEFTTPTIISKIMGGERPARSQKAQERGLTDLIWDVAVRCWHQDPLRRPTMMEVVRLVREWSVLFSLY